MGDMGELFNEWTKQKKAKKRDNQKSSTQILIDKDIEFEEKNWGNHLIVRGNGLVIDFWPSTGKWIVRNGRKGRGVFKLIALIDEVMK